MLTVGLAAYSLEAMAFYNTLETFTLRYTYYIDPFGRTEYVCDGECVTQLHFIAEVVCELYEFAFGCGSCLFKVAFESLAGVFLFHFVIGKLYSGITIILYCTNLRNNTRTSFNNGAWNVFSISIENGSHSDFFSN